MQKFSSTNRCHIVNAEFCVQCNAQLTRELWENFPHGKSLHTSPFIFFYSFYSTPPINLLLLSVHAVDHTITTATQKVTQRGKIGNVVLFAK